MLTKKRNDYRCILTSLALMNSHCVCQHQFIQLVKFIFDEQWSSFFYKLNCKRRFFSIDKANMANIPVKNAFIIIVAHLHHLITNREFAISPFYRRCMLGVEPLL